MKRTIVLPTVQIRRKGDNAWLTLGSPSSLNPWTAKIAGTFEMRGIGTVHGESVETPIEEVEVRFPGMYNLVNNAQDSPEGSGNIPHEHPINSPAGIYESFGEERRPTP